MLLAELDGGEADKAAAAARLAEKRRRKNAAKKQRGKGGQPGQGHLSEQIVNVTNKENR